MRRAAEVVRAAERLPQASLSGSHNVGLGRGLPQVEGAAGRKRPSELPRVVEQPAEAVLGPLRGRDRLPVVPIGKPGSRAQPPEVAAGREFDAPDNIDHAENMARMKNHRGRKVTLAIVGGELGQVESFANPRVNRSQVALDFARSRFVRDQ